MSKSIIAMPKEIKERCSIAIHTASVAAGGAGVAPIPVADTIPITTAQVAMIVSLGKIFDVTINESLTKAIIGCGLAQNVGRTISSAVLKVIPVVNVTVGPVANCIIASTLTEVLGWKVAEDFYRLSIGEEPENFEKLSGDLTNLFNTVINNKNKKLKTKK